MIYWSCILDTIVMPIQRVVFPTVVDDSYGTIFQKNKSSDISKLTNQTDPNL